MCTITRAIGAALWMAVLFVGAMAAKQQAFGQAAQRQAFVDPNTLFGRVVAVAADGRSVTIEAAPQARGEEPRKLDIKFNDATRIMYQNVGPGGAKPTEGYFARIILAEGSKDVAASAAFSLPDFNRADLIGRVASVSGDGMAIVVEGRPQARGEQPKTHDIKLTDKTKVVFQSVGPGGAKLAEGYIVQVWLQGDSKDTAARLVASSPPQEGRGDARGERRAPDVDGRVLSVSSDGKTVSLQTPPANRGEQPKKVDIKLTDATQVMFFNVARDGAKPKEDYSARVQLQPGSTDTAASVVFAGTEREPIDVSGRVVGVGSDGKSVTVETPPQARGEEAKKREIKLTDKTKVVYVNVGPNGAKPTEGYFTQVQLEPGATDAAASISFSQPGERR